MLLGQESNRGIKKENPECRGGKEMDKTEAVKHVCS
jgi:hypothetical protein